MGLSVVLTIFPFCGLETIAVHTSWHMLNQSITVLADCPVRVVTVDVCISNTKKNIDSNISHSLFYKTSSDDSE